MERKQMIESSAVLLQKLRDKAAASAQPGAQVSATTVEIKRLRDLKGDNGIRDMPMIDPRIIVVENGHNPRDYNLPENRAHLDELKASIRANGTLVPLLVRWDAANKSAILVDGECRLRANLELINEGVEIAAVPTVQVAGGNEADRLLTSITANTGKPLSKWELGTAFQRLYKFGWSEEQIASKTGYRPAFITEAMELADAPIEVKQLLSTRAVTPSLALDELRANGSAAVQTLQAMASKHKASGKRGPVARPVAKAPAPLPAPTLLAVIRELIEDVPLSDLTDASKNHVTVKREMLLKLASYAMTITQPETAAPTAKA
jgi:ParB/RepB/Spo0J family partition protein